MKYFVCSFLLLIAVSTCSSQSIVLSDLFINIGQTAAGSASTSSSFNFVVNGSINSFTVDAPPPFEVSNDNIFFTNQLSYSTSIAGIAQSVFVRIHPTSAAMCGNVVVWKAANTQIYSANLFMKILKEAGLPNIRGMHSPSISVVTSA